jgi:hypothetical protein
VWGLGTPRLLHNPPVGGGGGAEIYLDLLRNTLHHRE